MTNLPRSWEKEVVINPKNEAKEADEGSAEGQDSLERAQEVSL